MKAKKNKASSPTTLMQAYKQAYTKANQSQDNEETIRAYLKVVEFCANTKSCRWKPDIKRNMLLYWSHNNIAKAFAQREQYTDALNYWQKALYLAADSKQKAAVYEQMLDVWGKAPMAVIERCEEIVKVCANLSKIYMQEGKINDVVRLEKLKEKILQLQEKAEN